MRSGFTLAELIVATAVLTVVMTAVYTAFGSAIRAWRVGESQSHEYQDARIALGVMSHELGCLLGGTQHLFEGDNHEFEFFTVAPPMYLGRDTDQDEGPRVLWVRYRYNRTGRTLIRQEALVKEPLPNWPPGRQEVDLTRIKVGRKHKFEVARNVLGLDVSYQWVPPPPAPAQRGEPPPGWTQPIDIDENPKGRGLPQGLRVDLTIQDETAVSEEKTFSLTTAFRVGTTRYDEFRMFGEKGKR